MRVSRGDRISVRVTFQVRFRVDIRVRVWDRDRNLGLRS